MVLWWPVSGPTLYFSDSSPEFSQLQIHTQLFSCLKSFYFFNILALSSDPNVVKIPFLSSSRIPGIVLSITAFTSLHWWSVYRSLLPDHESLLDMIYTHIYFVWVTNRVLDTVDNTKSTLNKYWFKWNINYISKRGNWGDRLDDGVIELSRWLSRKKNTILDTNNEELIVRKREMIMLACTTHILFIVFMPGF